MPSEPRDRSSDGARCQALDNDLVWAIRMISTALRRAAAEASETLPGGSRAYLVLMALAPTEDNPPTQLELAGRVGLDRTVMTYLLDDLEERGVLVRRPNPRDRRSRHVILTDEGRAQLQRVRTETAAAETRLLAELGEEERTQFRDLLARVAHTAQRGTRGD
ncbi:MarR family winged helix-turn-helix transcriptional regulator [Streptomyces sp. YU58]|uniref:MarR family winged helix-turn-helix transcriptional regulator n=1 Tax=Streptomyces sp. SX92 TaxID=3158972 RepID=UPI0027BAD1C9|nr:MarR family transcriptional regulator [Streptomyces coralus]WLW54161.1 MarR family transcriptional regulator [Streptomyces coralus]